MCMNIMKLAVEYCESRPSTDQGEDNQNTQDNAGTCSTWGGVGVRVIAFLKRNQFHKFTTVNSLGCHKNNFST